MPKRIRDRVVVQRRVEYRHARGQSDGLLIELSPRGCRIKGASPFSCGTRLRLQLWLPDQPQPVKIEQSVVRWIKGDQFGVSFLDLSPDIRARLEQLFQLLHDAQQPEEQLIPGSAFAASYDGDQRANER